MGAECTGKTVLARELARHYHTVWVPEYLREFVDKKKSVPDLADIAEIARGQKESEATLLAEAQEVLFCDTCLLMTVIYSDYYLGDCPREIRQTDLEESFDLYLFTQDDIPWVEDSFQRDGPQVRALIQKRIKEELELRKIDYLAVSGSAEERLQLCIGAIDPLLR